MGYNQANYTRIRKEYETKYLRAREDADRRRAEALLVIPELADIDRSHISAIELGNVGVSMDLIFKLCDIFRVTPKELFDFRD